MELKRNKVSTCAGHSLHKINNVEIAVHDSAPGSFKPIIVCLHAIGHGSGDFTKFEKAFADHYRIISVDWPGHGYSSQDIAPASAIRYTELFTELVEKMNLSDFVILGNSIGGAVGIRYAAQNPNKVRALILSSPAGLDKGGFLAKAYIWWHEQKFKKGAQGDASFPRWFRKFYERILITPEAAPEKQAIVDSAFEIAPILAEAWNSFRQPEADLRPFIPSITAPILFAWAKRDLNTQWSRNKASVQKFSNAKVVKFDAGHSPFIETPEDFNKEALSFLESLNITPSLNVAS